MRLTLFALTLTLGVLAQHGSSEGVIGSSDPRFAAARATIARVMEEEKLPSVSVALAQDGRIVWQEAFGWANREKQIRATPTTAYSLASISKPITATGLMRLVEQKKVDLDRPANDYLGRGKLTNPAGGDANGATVRRVLSHTAGLPLHYQFYYRDHPYAEPPMDETIARYGILVTPPGSVFNYSNLGYGIVDQIIERVSGRPYAEFMRAEVFGPLGMRHSSVHASTRPPAEYAERYDAAGTPIPYYDFDHDGGSAVYASAHDLVKFGLFHLGAKLLEQRAVIDESSRRLMQTPQTPPGGDQYGLGWFAGEELGARRILHTGSMPGVTTILTLYPDDHVASVVLLNTSNARARTEIARALNTAALPRLAATGAPTPPRGDAAPVRLSADHAGQWSGVVKTWEGEVPLVVRVEADGDVKVRLGGGLWTLLNLVTWTDQRLTGRFAATLPTRDARRHPHTVVLDLRRRDGKFAGQVTAQTTDAPVYFALSAYAELAKRSGLPSQ